MVHGVAPAAATRLRPRRLRLAAGCHGNPPGHLALRSHLRSVIAPGTDQGVNYRSDAPDDVPDEAGGRSDRCRDREAGGSTLKYRQGGSSDTD